MEQAAVGGITTTEVCNITCVMCHFNGPWAPRKQGVLTVAEVKKYLQEIPIGQVWFAGTGEFFMDPNALTHLRNAIALGHQPCILTNGLLLTPSLMDEILKIGVRSIHISVDEIVPEKYRKIRIGGDLQIILDACAYLRARKSCYPDLYVGINVTLFKKTFPRQEEFIAFWRGKVDAVNFNAEYYDIFKFRNKFFEPEKRNDCEIKVYLLPTGQMSPCCAMTVYQHHHQVDWLPHIRDNTPAEAHRLLQQMYDDPSSPLAHLCSQCEWWILWAQDREGNTANPGGTPYLRCVSLREPVDSEAKHSAEELNQPVAARLSLPMTSASPDSWRKAS